MVWLPDGEKTDDMLAISTEYWRVMAPCDICLEVCHI